MEKKDVFQNYWFKKVENKYPLAVLKEGGGIVFNENVVQLKDVEINEFKQLTTQDELKEFALFGTLYYFLLRKYFLDFDGSIYSIDTFHAKNNHPLLFEFKSNVEDTFKNILLTNIEEIQRTLKYSSYESELNIPSLHNYTPFGLYIFEKAKLEKEIVGLFNLQLIKSEKHWMLKLKYDASFIVAELASHFLQHFKKLISNVNEIMSVSLPELSFVSNLEKEQLLNEFNYINTKSRKGNNLIDLFEKQVRATPGNLALSYKETQYTYFELNQIVNQLAHYISRNYELKSEDLIGLLIPKSDKAIVSILAILKVGAAFLPIDTTYPKDRINYIIKDSQLKLLICEGANNEYAKNCASIDLKSISIDAEDTSNFKKEINKTNLAYVIYTSGSTGHPKGVMVEHQGNMNMTLEQISMFEISMKDVVVWFASMSFDASVSEMMMALLSGASLSIPDKAEIQDINSFGLFLRNTSATVVTLPPSYLDIIEIEKLQNLRCIITAGEAAHVLKAIEVVREGIRYFNAYGPTECSVCVSVFELVNVEKAYRQIPIGKPISNLSVYLLDDKNKLVPIGMEGRLFVAGIGLARGYLHKPKLTQDKFVENPFAEKGLMYDTGDLARWLPDGNLEFIGRNDDQVKIRGHRIELGEVENTILKVLTFVDQAAVACKNIDGRNTLVAYIVSDRSFESSELKNVLRKWLPDYMIPAYFVGLDELPFTPNRKVDRKALPDIRKEDLITASFTLPENITEYKIAAIWKTVLNLDSVGVTSDFFALGGHSLMIAQVLNHMYKDLGKSISYKAFFETPTIKGIARKLQNTHFVSIPKTPDQSSHPLTSSQKRLWVLSQLEGGSLAYNMPAAVRLNGDIDPSKIQMALNFIIERYDILRTVFKENKEGEIRQFILPVNELRISFEMRDFQQMGKYKEALVKDFIKEKSRQRFNLEEGPLIRASYIQLDEKDHIVFLCVHHIVGDGWSLQLLLRDIIRYYNKIHQGQSIAPMNEDQIQYNDYAVWKSGNLGKEKMKEAERYWLQEFSGELPVLELPISKGRPLIHTYNGRKIRHTLPPEKLKKIKQFSNKENATLFMTLLSGVYSLLHIYTGQKDIILGTPVAGRQHPDLEDQVGLFLNTLAIRVEVEGKTTFRDLLEYQKNKFLNAYEHQEYPFDELIKKIDLKRDISRSALFDVMVVLQNQMQLHHFGEETIYEGEWSNFDIDMETAQFDLTFFFEESNGLICSLEYNTDVYEENFAHQLLMHFDQLLTYFMEHPDRTLLSADYLTEEEQNVLLSSFNNTRTIFPYDICLTDLIERQVIKTPDKLALICGEHTLTYKELNEKANQFAHYLCQNYDVRAEDKVCILLPRDESLMVSILGVLKSGAAYVPLDFNYPEERIVFMKNDCSPKVTINKKEWLRFKEQEDRFGTMNLSVIRNPSDLAYIIYTSGSTGTPKGVMIEQRNAVSLIHWAIEEFANSDFEIVYAATSHCFDLSVYEMFYPLAIGKKIRLLENGLSIQDFLWQDKKVLLNAVPSVIRNLLEEQVDFRNVALINMAGERLAVKIIEQLAGQHKEIRNLYGPSEDTTYSTCYKVQQKKHHSIPIGRPIANTEVFILNENLKLVPIGVEGKIYLSGAGLFRGYLNRPKLTKEKMFSHPFRDACSMYDTGDVGRWLHDGTIEFCGRQDHQVKINGYRIELEEIENQIFKFSKTIQQVVVEVKESQGDSILVAYYTSSDSIEKNALRSFLLQKLPNYMIPVFFVGLKDFPLTPNGKIDRKAMPEVAQESLIRKQYIEPRNSVEEKMRDIWEGILEINDIGMQDDFFELGGNSIKAVKLSNRIRALLNLQIQVKDVFQYPTIEELALLKKQIEDNKIPVAEKQDDYPLSIAQKHLWYLSQTENASKAYHIPIWLSLKGDLKVEVMEASLQKLIERHESLRTVFLTKENIPRQRILDVNELSDSYYNFISCSEEEATATIRMLFDEAFDLQKGPIIKSYLFQVEENKFLFFINIHHIICDGWSIKIMLNELMEIYNAVLTSSPLNLKSLNIQFKDYAVWQTQMDLTSQKKYWLQQFENGIPSVKLYGDKASHQVESYMGDRYRCTLGSDTKKAINAICKKIEITPFIFMYSTIILYLYKYTGQTDLVLATGVSDRSNESLENQIGYYVNTLPVRVKFSNEDTFTELMSITKQTFLNAFSHQYYNLGCLLEDIKQFQTLGKKSDLFNIGFTYQDLSDQSRFKMNSITSEVLDCDNATSKFDLSFFFLEYTNRICFELEYNSNLFYRDTIEQMGQQVLGLFDNLLQNYELELDQIDFADTTNESEIFNLING